jgi:hypothetical protein
MKKINQDYWVHKGYDIYILEHTKLYGKYQIHRNEVFITRTLTIKQAKELIDLRVNFLK